MNFNPEFTWEKVQQTVEKLIFQQTGKYLSDIEMVVLQGAWDGKTYEEIAEAKGYASSYLSRDVGNKLWSILSAALQEKVSKKNFKTALQREWYKHEQNNPSQLSYSSTQENIIFPEGSVVLGSPFYIERPHLESTCYQTVAKPGSLIRIKGAKWMGKTSLVNRILQQGRTLEYQVIYLDFGSVERSIVQNLDKLLRWLCVMVSRQLGLDNKVNEYWDTDILGSNDNCTVYFEEYILAKTTSAIALALDNIDRLFAYEEIIEDFFGMLRSWHEKGKTYQCWAEIRLILAHSTEVYIPLDINQSPFNAGLPILLEEFNPSQVEALAAVYKLDWYKSEVEKLMNLLGGHPYLVRLAMYQVKTEDLTLEQFLSQATSEVGIYSSLLRHLLNILKQSPKLTSAFAEVVSSNEPVSLDTIQVYQLHSIGLVKYQQNMVRPRCKLYRNYFNRILNSDDLS
ncbi:AAA-like domain-containing protein [Pleurocapsales cyanobacterium LEGE 10410]|nr:AAA-like domain-containing protein [Pleurocapsales cyanobacterium LEGE 10410]